MKGRADVVERVLVTPRGPVVSPALDGVDVAVSMRAVWLDPLPARGLTDVHKADTFDRFRRPFQEWPLTPQHFVYADTSGTVGWQLVGQAPVRMAGWGMVPARGSDPDAGWAGLVPFEEMPHATDPPAGFYVPANNPPLPEGEGPFLGSDWVNGYRAAAITEALERRADWDVTGCQRVQLSRRSVPWAELRDTVVSLPADDPAAGRGLALLRGWDGEVAADSPAAVFEFFLCELAVRAAKAKAPTGWAWALGKGGSAGWCRTPCSPTVGSATWSSSSGSSRAGGSPGRGRPNSRPPSGRRSAGWRRSPADGRRTPGGARSGRSPWSTRRSARCRA